MGRKKSSTSKKGDQAVTAAPAKTSVQKTPKSDSAAASRSNQGAAGAVTAATVVKIYSPDELGYYLKSVEDVTQAISCTPLREADLCLKFDKNISNETTMPEEGIQAARDLYIDVAKQQEQLMWRFESLSAEKPILVREYNLMKEQFGVLTDETARASHQREVLQNLAEELTKQKEKILNACQETTNKERNERQVLTEEYMKTITELSHKLDAHSKVRIAEAKRNEALRESLSQSIGLYQKAEEEFTKKMKECDEALSKYKTPKKKVVPETPIVSGSSEDAGGEQQEENLAEKQDESPTEQKDKADESDDEEYKLEMEKECKRTEDSRNEILTLVTTEKELRKQLAEYADHFERFQESLNKSNELFGGFKTRMEEMTAVIRNLEKENAELAEKEKKSVEFLAYMRAEYAAQLNLVKKTETQTTKMQNLVVRFEAECENTRLQIQLATAAKNLAMFDDLESSSTSIAVDASLVEAVSDRITT